jgi:hypothetical protein
MPNLFVGKFKSRELFNETKAPNEKKHKE